MLQRTFEIIICLRILINMDASPRAQFMALMYCKYLVIRFFFFTCSISVCSVSSSNIYINEVYCTLILLCELSVCLNVQRSWVTVKQRKRYKYNCIIVDNKLRFDAGTEMIVNNNWWHESFLKLSNFSYFLLLFSLEPFFSGLQEGKQNAGCLPTTKTYQQCATVLTCWFDLYSVY